MAEEPRETWRCQLTLPYRMETWAHPAASHGSPGGGGPGRWAGPCYSHPFKNAPLWAEVVCAGVSKKNAYMLIHTLVFECVKEQKSRIPGRCGCVHDMYSIFQLVCLHISSWQQLPKAFV